MKIGKIRAVYFSPTGTTKKTVCHIAAVIAKKAQMPVEEFDFTLPRMREAVLSFSKDDLVVFGVPVYAGRVPNVLLKYLRTVKGNQACAVPVVLYGNRAFDDALAELTDILEQDGLRAIAAGAFVGEHSFSEVLAAGRPDTEDLQAAEQLALQAVKKWQQEQPDHPVAVPGDNPSKGYYQPRDRKGNAIDIRKVKPQVNEKCNNCGLCVQICPMGSIDPKDVKNYQGICIKCGACIKGCPLCARYYNDEEYLYHKQELEEGLTRRARSGIWI